MDELIRPMTATVRRHRLAREAQRAMKPKVLIVCLAAVLAGQALAKPPAETVFISPSGEAFRPTATETGFEAWFAIVDTNHDGRIDRAEFRSDADRYFKRLDTDKDGDIDGFEIAAYEKQMAPMLDLDGRGFSSGRNSDIKAVSLLIDPEPVSGADLDLSSHISLSEWLAVADRRFDALDTRRQGWLTRDELAALLAKNGGGR